MISLLLLILELLTAWKVFEKYGEPGWKGLIPFYSDFVEYGKVWNSSVGIIYIVLVAVQSAFSGREGTMATVASIAGGLYFVLNIFFSIRKARAFGYNGWGMKAVLIFFPFIGNLIIGFGNAEYLASQD